MPSFSADARRAGPDACPGVHTVWSAVDGGLARVRIPGGRLSGGQLGALARAATELGSGVLVLTARANIQVRGLAPAGEHSLAARLREVDLLPSDTHDRVRNIVASPLTGLGNAGAPSRPDVSALIVELDEGLCAEAVLAGLPGRFLFAVDDGSLDVLDPPADVALIAAGEGYLLVLGGAPWGIPVSAEQGVPSALAAARAFLIERGRHCSPAWRLAELDDGPTRVAALVRADVALDADPLPVPTPARAVRPPRLGPARQGDGRIALTVGVPQGHLNASAAAALAQCADPEAGLRVTPWRSVVLPGLAPAGVSRIADTLDSHDLITDPTRTAA